MKIDLDIDPKIPQDVRNIILRAEMDINAPMFAGNPGQLAHIVSQQIQQAYYLGCLDGDRRTSDFYTNQIKNLGKAVQS